MRFDPSKCKIPPFKHQIEDVQKIVDHKFFGILSEMGTGKSAIGVNAACVLNEKDSIDTVVIVAPASVRCVWIDSEIGEIRKHAWRKSQVFEFHQKTKLIWKDDSPVLTWIVTNYEFLRQSKRLEELIGKLQGASVLLLLDESSYLKSRAAQQTKAIMKLRSHCDRCVIFTGTPVSNSPLDLWSQMNVLSPEILEKRYKSFYSFRAEYCELVPRNYGGMRFQQVVSYKRLDKLSKVIAPYILRRLKKDCLDLPEKLYTEREVALTPESWRRYKELRRDALLHLGDGNVQLEPNAAVRIMRLSQLTSGILGGSVETEVSKPLPEERLNVVDLSDEKLNWAVQYLTEECTARAVIVWTRWRRERERLFEALSKSSVFPFQLYGGQPKSDREQAVSHFSKPNDAELAPRYALIAQPHAGGHGLNLIAASEAIYLSNDFSLGVRLQSEDRCHRPGQKNPVTYIDALVVGPEGQKTIDHLIVKALRDKQNLANLTAAYWRKELERE